MRFPIWWKRSPRAIQASEYARSRNNDRCARPRIPGLERLEERLAPASWSGDISTNTTWSNTSVQNIVGAVHVDKGVTLTIQASTVVQFNYNTGLTVDGTLLAQGAAGQTIYFTSVLDNSPSGGSNTASPGSWNNMTFNSDSTGSILDHVEIRYGDGNSNYPATILDDGGPLTLTNSVVAFSADSGLRIQDANPTISNDTFHDNHISYHGAAAISMDLDSNPTITDLTLTNNDINGVAIDGGTIPTNGQLGGNDVWDNPDIVYVMTGGVTVPQGASLTIGAGQVVKVAQYKSLIVAGTLSVNGTAASSIEFTDVRDDSAGGDTNNDGSASTPAPGWWGDIEIDSGGSAMLNHVVLRYGAANNSTSGELYDNGGTMTLSNSEVAFSADNGMRIQNASPTLANDSFHDNHVNYNGAAAISMNLASSPTITGITLSNNDINSVTVDGGTISTNTSWDNPDIVYWLTNLITVNAGVTLTIGAGQVIKFGGPGYNNITVNGTLLANGTASQPIVFTTTTDDSAGGDTNNDGTTTSPKAGNWADLLFTATSTADVLDDVALRYGGNANGEVEADSNSPTISNCTFSYSSSAGVRLSGSNATLGSDTFQDNSGGAVSINLASDPTITGASVASNGINGVAVDGGTISANNSWNNPDVVYWLTNLITVNSGVTLTIGAGQIIKFGGPFYNGLTVDGTLSANGTGSQPIVFTSSRDDSAGGDTNNDGTASSPKAGDWSGLLLTNTSTGDVFDYVQVRYCGVDANGELEADGNSPVINNCTFSNSSDAGVRLSNSNATFTNDTFLNNAGGAIRIDLGCSPTISGSTLTNNGVNGVAVDGGTISTNVTWNNPDIAYLLTGIPTVAAGATLTIGAGQIIKFGGPFYNGLTVNGTLVANGTASQPIVFTAAVDDSVGGDTNNDGTATSPKAGDWSELLFTSTSTANVLDNVEVLYSGVDANAAIEADGASMSLSNCTVSLSSAGGVILSHSNATLTDNSIHNNDGTGVRLTSSNATLTGNTFVDNFGPAISMDDASSPVISGTTLTNNQVNGVSIDGGTISANASWNSPSIVYFVNGSVTVASGATLTIGAGQVIKFSQGYNELEVKGTLLAAGSAFQQIVFTSLRDDSAVGDTNNDGSTTSPAAGDWLGVFFDSGSTGNLLDHVTVRYGGSDYFVASGEVYANNAGLTLSNSILSNSAVGGLQLVACSPTVTADTLQNNNGAAIHIDPASNPVISGVTATGNVVNGVVVGAATFGASVPWAGQGLPYSLSGTVTVPQGDTLSIAANTEFVGGDSGDINGSGTLTNAGTFLMAPADNGTMNVSPQLVDTGTLNVQKGTLNLNGGLTVNGEGIVTGNPGATINIRGNLGGNTQNADQFAPGIVNFNGSGTASTPQTLEVMSQDLGNTATGFANNFVYYGLSLSNGTSVQLVDNAHNSQGAGADALYVDNLSVPSGTTLDLNGLHLYARIAQIHGTILNGTITPLASGGALSQDVTSAGSLVAGATDDWTFFGRTGEIVTIVVNTGSGGSPAPFSPALNFATVNVVTPFLKVLATQSNTQSGGNVTFTGVTLSSDATYQVQVQAGQSGGSGNYNITYYDATPQTEVMNLGQTTTGTIDNPYRTDNWTFTGTAGEVVQFNLINSSNPAIAFDLTGPNGYTAFTNATASSGSITLPTSGTYTLTAHGTQQQTGSYAFQIVNAGITDLTLGAPITQTIQGTGQAQIYRLNIAQAGQVNITLTDSTSTDENELYESLGTVPTRGQFQPLYYTGASADKQLSIPTAAPGIYYILVYTAYAPAPSSFTLEATESSVFLTGVTPNRSGTSVDTTLNLSGAGFDSTATVSLVSGGGTAFSAGTVSFDSPTLLTATFAAGSVPAGVYSAKVSEDGGATTTLANAITIDQGGQANFQASVIVPSSMGYHIPGTIYVEYSNTGDVAMPAPLLLLTPTQTHADGSVTADAFLTLDPSLVTQGFWTSALPDGFSHTVEILASGSRSGVLQPGESERVPVYYAGWQQPWDLSYPPFNFHLDVVKADDPTAFDWAGLKQNLPAPPIDPAAWDAIWSNLQAQVGSTWGNYVSALDQNTSYLGQLGVQDNDPDSLAGFEIDQANGIDPITLATAEDISVPAPGLPLSIDRSSTSSIAGHYVFGPFGYGWALDDGWGETLSVQSDGTVIITNGDGAQRIFQPDSRVNGAYFGQSGDGGVLADMGNGVFTLTEQNGQLTEFQNGQIALIQDSNGNRITAGYTNGLLTSLTDASGAFIHLSYNAAGLVASTTNSLSQTATYTYDSANQYLLSVTDYEGLTTSYTYFAGTNPATNHALESVTNPDGITDDYSFDARGRLSEISVNGGSLAVNYTYGIGGIVSVTNAGGATYTNEFDDRGLLDKVIDPLQHVTLFHYDGNGNLVQETDPAGQVYSYAYDAQGNMIQSTDPLGEVTQFTYGPLESLTSITDPKGNTTRYQYNQNGDPVSVHYANGTIETDAYNPIGEILQSTNQDGKTTSYTYNSAGQMLTATEADGSVTTYGYDAHGNLTSATDASGTINLTYSSIDLLTEVTYPNGSYLKYSYDSAGRIIQMVDETGFTVKYVYDSLGRLSGLTDGSGNPIATYSFDAAGNISKQLMGDGTYTLYSYDVAGDVRSVVNYSASEAVNSSFVYTYNNLGLASSETTLDGQWTYTYDAVGQLTHAVFTSNDPLLDPNQDLQYTYDAAGNRISTVVNGTTTSYVTNNMNQYTSVGATTYSYDADGNLSSATTAGVTTTYGYDLGGHLVAVSAPGSTSTYQYNALGERVASTFNGQTTQYLIDPAGVGNVEAEFDGAGNLIAHFTTGMGLTSRVDANNVSAYYTFDGNGNTVALTGSAGSDHYSYLPFGQFLTASGSINNPFEFSGQSGVMTSGNGPLLMAARSYDPITGRFMQMDPIGAAGGLNVYAYTENNPVTASDPSGLTLVTGPAPQSVVSEVADQLLCAIAEAGGKSPIRKVIAYDTSEVIVQTFRNEAGEVIAERAICGEAIPIVVKVVPPPW